MDTNVDTRCFQDPSGQTWTVFESSINGQRCLHFDSADAFRRVRDFPDDWRNLSVEALVRLSWSR